MFNIIFSKPSLTNLQRCYFPDSISPECHGKYAFITTSHKNVYFIKICVNPLLKDGVCMLDETVQCNQNIYKFDRDSLSFSDIEIVPSLKLIKTIHAVAVFKSVWELQKWYERKKVFTQLVKEVLELLVLTNKAVINISELCDINKVGLHLVIINSIGNIVAGKVVEHTKLELDEVTCYDRYIVRQPRSSLIRGLTSQHYALKDLVLSCKELTHSPSLPVTSSMKILIVGPDGSGKKSLVRSVAAEMSAVVVTIDGPELNRPQPGETERLLKQKFDEAHLHSKEGLTVLLVVRIDSVCAKKGRILSEFLHLLDSVPPTSPFVLIGTTAKPHLLHEAIRSSARFQYRIFFNIPSEEERAEMLDGLCSGQLSPEQITELAHKTPGFVLADISLLVSKAKRHCLQKTLQTEARSQELFSAMNDCVYQIEPSSVRGELGVVKADKLDISELGGLSSVKNILVQSVCWPLSHPEAYRRFNISRSSGVLLYGPPGCAKTSLARAIASSSNVTFLSVSAADLFSPYVGDAELTLTNLFQRARDAAPTILFIDEIDALVGSREEKQHSAQERILSVFLVEMDGIGIRSEDSSLRKSVDWKVTVIGASNRPDSLDPALLRPGRLDRLVYVPAPHFQDRLEILSILTQKIPLSGCVDLKHIAERTEFYSGADLRSLCQEAGLQALISDGMDAELVTQEHWLRALEAIPPSLTSPQLDWFESFSFT